MTEAELDKLMKKCQTGHYKWGELNNLLAECYGAIGYLRHRLDFKATHVHTNSGRRYEKIGDGKADAEGSFAAKFTAIER
jgi:hypothetical protein